MRIPEVMTKEEILKFFSVIYKKRDLILYKLIYYCGGLRILEATKLRKEDIDFNQKRIFIRKGKFGKDRYNPIPDFFIEELKDYLIENKGNYLFPTEVRRFTINPYVTSDYARHIFKEYLKKAGLKLTYHPHTLRHSIATHVYNNMIEKYGMANLLILKDMLGHEDLQTINVYVHTNIEPIRKEINNLFN